MADPFLGEIRLFGFNFNPKGWALCNGQLMPVSQNEALYSLLKYTYGGSGNRFGLPNLQGSRPVMAGQGTGLSNYNLGQTGGTTTVPLTLNQLPGHSHAASAVNGPGGAAPATNTVWSEASKRGVNAYAPSNSGSNVQMSSSVASTVGGGMPHNNMQPYLTLNFCIATTGIMPQS